MEVEAGFEVSDVASALVAHIFLLGFLILSFIAPSV